MPCARNCRCCASAGRCCWPAPGPGNRPCSPACWRRSTAGPTCWPTPCRRIPASPWSNAWRRRPARPAQTVSSPSAAAALRTPRRPWRCYWPKAASLGVRDDDGAKLLFSDIRLAARLVLIDPVANLGVPAALMCATGMNGLAHCIEGLYSRERSPLAETVALDAMARFAEALPAVHRRPGDAAARGRLLYAAHLSGRVLLNARTCLHHAICHAIGAVTGVGHGDANAVMLSHAVAFNAEAAAPALARAAAALGADAEAAALVPALRALQAAAGVPTRLRDIGVPAAALERIAAKTMRERGLHYNPRPVSGAHEVRAVLDAAF
ncbi:MAG: iron-containing alcohol dehydrogenase [Variovorax sp.]|nr:MAG: iron-containing alcohol dehydrogenase [Variovorax sp.]